MSPEEIVERRAAFNRFLVDHGGRLGYYKLPSSIQGQVHEMLRKTFNAGYNAHKRYEEPTKVGGLL